MSTPATQIHTAGTYATPRMRLIFPGSTKLRVLTCLTIGHRNWISPPPPGAAPRFLILNIPVREPRSLKGSVLLPVAPSLLIFQKVVGVAR